MRDLLTSPVGQYRDRSEEALKRYNSFGDETCGPFVVPSPLDKAPMRVIASSGGGWDHVSVSRKNRCPNWPEMEHIAKLFFQDDEVAMQLHVPSDKHINVHPNCLHWWRPQATPIPFPPREFV